MLLRVTALRLGPPFKGTIYWSTSAGVVPLSLPLRLVTEVILFESLGFFDFRCSEVSVAYRFVIEVPDCREILRECLSF